VSAFRLSPLVILIFLAGCASAPEQQDQTLETTKPVESLKNGAKPPQATNKSAIDPDVLFMLLTAELAGQRGQYDIALEGYMEAAKRVKDPKIAERAAMIAMYVKDGRRTNEAVSLWLKKEPANLDARKIAAFSALKAGDKAVATEQFSQILEQDPDDFEKTVFELIGALQKEKNLNLVYEVLDGLGGKYPDRAAIPLAQSVLAADMKNMALAEQKINQSLKLSPDWDKALILQAQMAVYSGDSAKAEALLREHAAKYPNNPKFNKMLAQILVKSGKFEEAGEVYESLISADPKDTESRFSLGLVHMELGEESKAEDALTESINDPEWHNQSAFYLGKLAEKKGDSAKALAWFDQVDEGPFALEAAMSAVALLGKSSQYDAAEQRLAAAEAKFPNQKTRLILLRAELLGQQKKYDQAFAYLGDALKASPDQEELLYSRALVADRLGKLDVMEADLKKILTNNPDNAEALNALGYGLTEHSNRYQEAEGYLQRALQIKPNEAVIVDSYGWLKYKMGDYPAALRYLRQAYEKQSENEIAAHLAEVLWVSGQKDEALKVFKKAFSDAPGDSYLLNFKQRFLRDSPL
jgi:tetratricopeptide (TPR) repeat protein